MVETSKRLLTQADISLLKRESYPHLSDLSSRYLPEINVAKGFPAKAEFLDVLRTSWLLDTSPDRPELECVILGLGYALGLIIRDRFGFDWYHIRNEFGEAIAMVGLNDAGSQITVTPFAYVEKKGDFPNAEVFIDLFHLLARQGVNEVKTGTE
ncbi:hypothetical protein [Dyella mobilis]|uniref:DUF3806 domain-containing protein n=1 Tax=Dyella mobilis TaxID=1849582 RepID=A0ABS2KET6_9GAMM|nr:hypothetical protein [Dyella mobilis]MBM7129560.1 hypothetical protein [Dyella mobilis]GLQ98176.1 hypothetical protein GCM10007863_25960 [Dyella mobilis]